MGIRREDALSALYSEALVKAHGRWPDANQAFDDAFASDKAVLAKLPKAVANEIDRLLADDNPLNLLRQGIRSQFWNAEKTAKARAVAILAQAARGKTAGNHPASLRNLSSRAEVTAAEADMLVAFAKALDKGDLRRALTRMDQGPGTRVAIDLSKADSGDLPGSSRRLPTGVRLYLAADGIWAEHLGTWYAAGPLPPVEPKAGKTPEVNDALRRVVRDYVNGRVFHTGNGFWRLPCPPPGAAAKVTIPVDAADLLGPRRDAHLVGGRLYATFERHPEPIWFDLGELPRGIAKAVDLPPTLGSTAEARAYLVAHPTPEPELPPPLPFTEERGWWVAPLSSDIAAYLDEDRPDVANKLPLVQGGLAALREAGVERIAVFVGNVLPAGESIARLGLHCLCEALRAHGASFATDLAAAGSLQVTNGNRAVAAIYVGSAAQSRAAGEKSIGEVWGGEHLASLELVPGDPPQLRAKALVRRMLSSRTERRNPERGLRELLEGRYWDGPCEIQVGIGRKEKPKDLDDATMRKRVESYLKAAVDDGRISAWTREDGPLDSYRVMIPARD